MPVIADIERVSEAQRMIYQSKATDALVASLAQLRRPGPSFLRETGDLEVPRAYVGTEETTVLSHIQAVSNNVDKTGSL